jgi:uncharacterized protein (TIGR02569 family)
VTARPPARVVAAFGGSGEPEALAGGSDPAWRAGAVVLKRFEEGEEELAWLAEALPSPPGLRVARPLSSADGRFAVDGWMATAWLAGEHRPRSWLAIIEAGDELHRNLAAAARPSFLDSRADPWAVADRLAWGEARLDLQGPTGLLDRLGAAMRDVDGASQVVHGDLTGNVLFADGLPPAVIDVSPYWRPRDYAAAIVVADALVWEGATAADLEAVLVRPGFGQHLVRALRFRLAVDVIRAGRERADLEAPYLDAADLALHLAS